MGMGFSSIFCGCLGWNHGFNGELSTQNCELNIIYIRNAGRCEMEMALDGMKLASFIVIVIWLAFKIPGLKDYIKWAQLELKS